MQERMRDAVNRRAFNLSGIASILGVALGGGSKARAMTVDDYKKRAEEYRAKALANFPFELIETTGEKAFAEWKALKGAGRGTPVIVGGDDNSFGNLLTPFGPNGPRVPPPRPVAEILKATTKIHFPADLIEKRRADNAAAMAQFKAMLEKNPNMPLPTEIVVGPDGQHKTLSHEETLAHMLEKPREPPIGDWPEHPDEMPGVTVVSDILKGTLLALVRIALIPTDDWTTIPAYLRWGGWNECPAPEYHVAAFRSWRDRYGVELVGLSFDTLNLTVARPPETRGKAMALAHEQYVYCSDIIDQGTQTYSVLAASLMNGGWWYFWWD
jgi:Domain of unknown function (DUF4253)